MTASKTNLWAGAVLLVVGVMQVSTDSPWLGAGLFLVGAMMIGQYFYLKHWGDNA